MPAVEEGGDNLRWRFEGALNPYVDKTRDILKFY